MAIKNRTRTFYIPPKKMDSVQTSAYLTYMKKKAIQTSSRAPSKRELSPAQNKALAFGRKTLAQKQVRHFFGQQGEVEHGTGSGKTGQLVASAYKPKPKVNWRKTTAETVADYAREKEYLANKKKIAFEESKKKYQNSKFGKYSRGAAQTFGFIRSPVNYMARKAYGSQMAPQGYSSSTGVPSVKGGSKGRGGGRGRPRGSLDRRYAAYGGVYGFRKAMAHQRRMERLQAQQQANLTPEQVMAIRATRARMANPENGVIPSTAGNVDMSGYMNEIDFASGAGDRSSNMGNPMGGMPD